MNLSLDVVILRKKLIVFYSQLRGLHLLVLQNRENQEGRKPPSKYKGLFYDIRKN